MLALAVIPSSGITATFTIKGSAPVIGTSATHLIRGKESLLELARQNDLGYNEIVAANRDIDPWVPDEGTPVIIPTSWIVPQIDRGGIVINLAEMRLYYFFQKNGTRYVSTYPIGIGRDGTDTPVGQYRITMKIKDPVWHVPAWIRAENPELPARVLPGPENPLGKYWLQLSEGYGIHGTNRPYGVGRRVSHGCIRLYPEDIESLAARVRPGVTVSIINDPVKAGLQENKIYMEVHRNANSKDNLVRLATIKLSRKRLLKNVDTALMIDAIKKATGLPAVISR